MVNMVKLILKEGRLLSLFIVAVSLVYFFLRLPNLTSQPIFADEAIYIRWAQVMRAEPTLRFLPLSDGKTPLFMWLIIPLLKIFEDPLFAGRLLSVLSGYLTLLGVLFLGTVFFNKKTGIFGAFFMATSPFMVFFDRMALVDSMLAAFSVWSLNFTMLVIKYSRLSLAMILGYLLGGAVLTKTPGFFNILVLPASLLVFDWSKKARQVRLIKLCLLFGVSVGIAMVMYNLLRLGPGFLNLSSRNQDYVFSPLFIMTRPLDPFIPHLKDLMDWFPKLLTWPILIVIFGGVILTALKLNRYSLVVLFWCLIPLLVQMALLKTFTARYTLFAIPPLLLLGGWFVSAISSKIKLGLKLLILVWLLLFLPLTVYSDYLLLNSSAKVPLPRSERRGYLEDWTAGYGLKQIAAFFNEQSKKQPIVVGTEGSFGTLPDGLQIYLDKNRQVAIIGGKATISAQLRDSAKDHPTYFVTNRSRFDRGERVELVMEYPKAKGPDIPQDAILVFKVFP